MKPNLTYLYLLSPLHTGGTTQEGNLVGIARETHSDLPYLPSSTIRGRLRAATPKSSQTRLWGNTIEDVNEGTYSNLIQGSVWIGDAAVLWFPVASLSHGVIWITSPFLLRRWLRLHSANLAIPEIGSFSAKTDNHTKLYLRDAIFQPDDLKPWTDWKAYILQGSAEVAAIGHVLVLSDADCQVLIQTSLWRQVRVNLGDGKTIDENNGGFRYEEAIPPETLMYFPWDVTTSANGSAATVRNELRQMLQKQTTWQFGGQESLGRGFTDVWVADGQESITEQVEETQPC